MKGTRLTTFKNLLRFVILGDFSANKLKYILTIMGIALGIGIFVAVETAHDTIKQSFQQTRGYVPGRPDLQVSAGEFGFDEEIIRRIEAHPMVARTHPLLIVPATLKKGDREIPSRSTARISWKRAIQKAPMPWFSRRGHTIRIC